MSNIKQRHKEYLIKNEIKDLTDLVNYIEILRNTSNLQGEDRQMLFDFAFLIVNEQSSLKSFFAENKNPSKEFYNAFKQTTSSPTFMDEVLDSNTTTTEIPNFEVNYTPTTGYKDPEKYILLELNKLPEYKEIDDKELLNDYVTRIIGNNPPFRTVEGTERQGEFVTMKGIFPKVGKKEKEGKLHYELSWEFIEEMAKRMANNKSDKYPLYNWKQKINVQDLKDAINRHHVEVMKGNYKDGDEIFGHIVQYACNSMMLWEQLRSKS